MIGKKKFCEFFWGQGLEVGRLVDWSTCQKNKNLKDFTFILGVFLLFYMGERGLEHVMLSFLTESNLEVL